MRKTLFAAVALAPMWLLAAHTPAAAATTIGNSTNTPVTTAADGDITISSGGSISPAAANTAAVTLNSNNSVTNSGTISYSNFNNVVGILVQGGNTGTVTNAGAITVNESYAAKDSNNDGVNEAPFASATSSGRYGIQLVGAQPFVGDVVNSGSITVQGDNSFGISLEAPLQGNLTNSGSITLTGDNSVGLRETAGVSGNVLITGTVTATGQNSNAVVLSGDVGGRVSLYASVTSTDYGSTTRSLNPTTLNTIEGTASEVNPNAGSAMIVSGNVAGGIFLGAPPPNTNSSDTTTDADGDGIVDSAETSSLVTTYGSAPALVIGSATKSITVSEFDTTGAHDNAYGLIVEGSIEGFGIYDGVPATGLQIGGLGSGTFTTTILGGLKNTGTIEAVSFGANALAIHLGSGAIVPTIENTGTITASVSPPNTTTSTYPSFTATATALQIDAGASVSSLINSGHISASITGDSGDAIGVTAVVDKGGGISSVTNTGSISASFTADATAATAATTTKFVALDLSANTTGVTLTQQQAPTEVVTTTTANSVTTSVVTYTAPTYPLVQSTTSSSTTTTSGNTTVVTTIPASPSITGDIILGSGANTVNILAGTVTGALNLGSGPTSSLTIDNGAIYTGALSYTGGALTVNVNNGTLNNSNSATYKTANLSVGSSGVIYFGVDPVNNRAAQFLVSGAASFASGSKIGLNFTSNATAPETFTLVSARSLTVGESNSALAGPVPYMFDATVSANTAAGTINVTISPKTAAELGLNPSQSAALSATYQALTLDAPVQAAFLGQYTKGGFLSLYNQLLPDYAGGVFQAANAASLAISRATAESNDIENPSGSRGAWTQEIFVGVNQGAGLTDGFRGGGFGFVGGVETGGSGFGAFGVTSAFVATSTNDPHIPGDSQTSMSELELGGYWQGEFNGLVADARVGAGYTWMAGRRELVQTDSTTGDITLDRKVKSNWNGYTLSGRFGLAYKWSLNDHFLGGGWFVQPQTHVDYFRLSESAYHDNEAEGGPALAMAFQDRTGQETSGTASILFGRKLGTGLVWRPSLELGVRDVFSGDAGDTTAKFISGGPSFTLTPADITGAAGIARFKLKASSEYYELGVEAGGEVLSSRYQEGDMKMSIRVLF